MAVPPEVRVPLENNRTMVLYQPALGQSLDAMVEGEVIQMHGFASVGNCQGYYLITNRGVHFCDKVRVGLLKKTYVKRFLARSQMASAVIDQIAGPQFAYLRIFDENKKMVLVFWFDEEPWQDAPCIEQAHAVARVLGFE